jgi:hypothetical protein
VTVLFRGACERHGRALLEFVDGRAAGPATDAALRHLATCRSCERDVADTAQLVYGLRRLGARAARVQPREGGWGRVMSRIEGAPRWPRHLPPVRIAGVVMAPLLALALAVPFIAPAAPCVGPVDRPAPTCEPTGSGGGWPGPQLAFLISDAANAGDMAIVSGPGDAVTAGARPTSPASPAPARPGDDRRLGPSVNPAAPAAQPREGTGAVAPHNDDAPPSHGWRGLDVR